MESKKGSMHGARLIKTSVISKTSFKPPHLFFLTKSNLKVVQPSSSNLQAAFQI